MLLYVRCIGTSFNQPFISQKEVISRFIKFIFYTRYNVPHFSVIKFVFHEIGNFDKIAVFYVTVIFYTLL